MSEGPPLKKKRDTGTEQKESPKPICIVHLEGLKYGNIQMFSTKKKPEGKLSKLQDIRKMRLAQPAGSAHRMASTCALIPDVLQPHHGFHEVCYKRFTMNLDRLKPLTDEPQPSSSRTRDHRSSSDHVLFAPDCIFCNSEKRKKIKVKGGYTTEGMSMFDKDGGSTVLDVAERKKDEKLLRRIRGQDLFACEAKYHRSCRSAYIQDPSKWRSLNEVEKESQEAMEKAHNIAFNTVCKVVDEEVLEQKYIKKLSDLCRLYISSLENTDYANPSFRGENLKKKLENHYCDRLSFCSLGKFRSYILYSSDIDMNKAMRYAYELGSRDMLEDAGTHLHQVKPCVFTNNMLLVE